MGEQTLSQLHLSTAAAQESPATTKIPFHPRKIRKVSSEGEPQQDSSSSSSPTKKAANSRAPLLRVVSRPLSIEGEIDAALRHLRVADPHLARVIDVHDPPIFQCLHPPFHSLARSILYQQLALKAAVSIYDRFVSLCGSEANVITEAILAQTPSPSPKPSAAANIPSSTDLAQLLPAASNPWMPEPSTSAS